MRRECGISTTDRSWKNHNFLPFQRIKTKDEDQMDKQINKVKKSLDKGEKDVKVLKKMDKKFDRKLEKCDKKMMKHKAGRGR